MKKLVFAENGQKGPNMLPVGDKKWLQMGIRKKKENGVKNRPNMEKKNKIFMP